MRIFTLVLGVSLALAPACGSDKTTPAPSPAPGSAAVHPSEPAVPVDAPSAPSAPAEPSASAVVPTPDAIRALHKELFGGVTLGMPQGDVIKVLGAPGKKTKPAPEEKANGQSEYFAKWTWPGIEATFGSASATDGFTLRSITFRAPSKAKTARGIGIGSTRAEVAKAYADVADPVFAKDPRFLVAGQSSQLGLNGLSFDFNKRTEFDDQTPNDKVTSMEAAGGAED
jgi:hypothetical protein